MMTHGIFQLEQHSFKLANDQFKKIFPELLKALEQEDSREFIRLIASFASFFIRQFTKQKGKEADLIDEFNKAAVAFMQSYHNKNEIDENNFMEKLLLSEKALVEYGKIISLCRVLSCDYLDYKIIHNPGPAELVRFARLHVVRPFILNFLPIDLDELCYFSSEKTNIEPTLGSTLMFYETIQLHVLTKNCNDAKILDTISEQLEKIQYRLEKDKNSWLRRILMESPSTKLWLVSFLLEMTKRPTCTLGEFDDALSSTLEIPLMHTHRSYFTQHFGQFFKSKSPRIVDELENIRQLLHKRVFPERIASQLA